MKRGKNKMKAEVVKGVRDQFPCDVISNNDFLAEICKSGHYQLTVQERSGGHYEFEGFHYFTPDCIHYWNQSNPNSKYKFIVARTPSETGPHSIVGVTLIGQYEEEPPYKAIQFIDVRRDYKRRGVATSMIKTLDLILANNEILVGSSLSEEGIQSNLHNLVRRYLTKSIYFDSLEEMWKKSK
jgi:hypothetical protein